MAGCATGRPPPPLSTTLPPGTQHTVRTGETLAAIGRLYGVSWQRLARINRLTDPDHLEVGRSLSIPGPGTEMHRSSLPVSKIARFTPETALQWPTTGILSSGFGNRGRRFHGGIDISGERSTPIAAAANGLVIFSGRGPDGYGNMVMMDHGASLITLYAHHDRNIVRVGERVRRGQTIALMGDSGRASGTHLHFEVHQDGRLVNPLRWLR
jgi:lipoprotein NlpD